MCVPEVKEKPEIYKTVNPNAKWFKCADCGDIENRFGYNPYGASFYLCALLHLCRACVRKISIIGDGTIFYNLVAEAEKLEESI